MSSFHITRLTSFPLRTALAMQPLCGLLDSSGWLVEATNTTPTRSVPFFQVLLTEFNDLAKRGNAIRRPSNSTTNTFKVVRVQDQSIGRHPTGERNCRAF